MSPSFCFLPIKLFLTFFAFTLFFCLPFFFFLSFFGFYGIIMLLLCNIFGNLNGPNSNK